MTPEISVITPTFNRCEPLKRAIASLQAQDFDNFEHIIVDDASTDETSGIAREIEDTRIRWVALPEWQGANQARNVGISASRSDLITFLDSDDEFLPHRLSSTIRFFEENPETNLLISSFATHKGGRVFSELNPSGFFDAPQLEEALFAHAILLAGSAITVRRTSLERIGGFDPLLFRMQDRDLLLRLARKEGARLSSQMDWIKHRSPDSISAPRETYRAALANLLQKHDELARRERSLVGYLLARSLLADLLHLDWGNCRRGLRENRSLSSFQFPLWQLLSYYRSGKRDRRSILTALRERK